MKSTGVEVLMHQCLGTMFTVAAAETGHKNRTLSEFRSYTLSVLPHKLILCSASSRDSVAITNPTSGESPNAERRVGLDFFCIPVLYHLPNPSTILGPHHDDYSLSETTLGHRSLT